MRERVCVSKREREGGREAALEGTSGEQQNFFSFVIPKPHHGKKLRALPILHLFSM
jgi:hypothetical protein